ncbi:MAG TPA: hypothetical protein VHE79_03605 [Spirochaetia bacterium]
MKHIVWDYDVDPYELYEVVSGKRDAVGHFDAKRVLARMLERLSWYDLLDLLGVETLRARLTPELIAGLRHQDVRERYEHVRNLLQNKAVSVSGWDPRYREKVRNSLLSHRWYRFEQALVRP